MASLEVATMEYLNYDNYRYYKSEFLAFLINFK